MTQTDSGLTGLPLAFANFFIPILYPKQSHKQSFGFIGSDLRYDPEFERNVMTKFITK